MLSLDFWECKAKINKSLDNRLLYIEEIDNNWVEDTYNYLNSIFNYGLDSKCSVKNMIVKETSEYTIYEYNTVSPSNTKTVNNLAVVKDRKPVFFASSYKFQNGCMIRTEATYANYREENGHLDNKISIVSTNINNSITDSIVAQDRPLKSDEDYLTIKYNLHYVGNNLLSVEIGNELYIESDLRVSIASNRIEEITTNISHVIDAIAGIDNVKGYKVKRKNRK